HHTVAADGLTGFGVPPHDVDALHDDPGLPGQGPQDLSGLAPVLAGRDDDGIAGGQVEAASLRLRLVLQHHRTSGARETIFMKLRSRSSRATGPKMRVPRGLFWLLMTTAALSSKRMFEPSGRRYSLATRTTTAFTTSPFFTCPPGCAVLTVAVTTSPTEA